MHGDNFSYKSRASSVGIALGYGVLGFDSRQGLGIFLFTTASRTAPGSTQPPIQWVPGFLSLGVKRLGREADHSPPSSAEVKNAWSYNSTPQYVFIGWCLVKHGDIFTFTFCVRKREMVSEGCDARYRNAISFLQMYSYLDSEEGITQ
jgi:hypothetical protein